MTTPTPPDPALIAELVRENEWLRARVVILEKALTQARDDLADWGAYASDYFQEKWGLEADIAAVEAALVEEPK
jgi:hypothetical protein